MEQNQNNVQEDRISIIEKFEGVVRKQNELLEERLYKGLKSKQELILKELKEMNRKIDILVEYSSKDEIVKAYETIKNIVNSKQKSK